jgi:hypothetical protein
MISFNGRKFSDDSVKLDSLRGWSLAAHGDAGALEEIKLIAQPTAVVDEERVAIQMALIKALVTQALDERKPKTGPTERFEMATVATNVAASALDDLERSWVEIVDDGIEPPEPPANSVGFARVLSAAGMAGNALYEMGAGVTIVEMVSNFFATYFGSITSAKAALNCTIAGVSATTVCNLMAAIGGGYVVAKIGGKVYNVVIANSEEDKISINFFEIVQQVTLDIYGNKE